jgi:hypothetical protein
MAGPCSRTSPDGRTVDRHPYRRSVGTLDNRGNEGTVCELNENGDFDGGAGCWVGEHRGTGGSGCR